MTKKKPPTRRERIVELRVDFGGDTVLTGMSPPGAEPLQFFGPDGKPIAPKSIEVGLGYAREKKHPKIIHRATSDPMVILTGPTEALMRFKTLIAVDTNTRVIDGIRVSVAAACVIRGLRFDENEPARWHAQIIDQLPIEFHDAEVSPEVLGWHRYIHAVAASELERPVGVIVDSELGRLAEINARTAPLFEQEFLPDDFVLVYASAEVGVSEYAGNQAIRHCDKLSGKILDRIAADSSVRKWPVSQEGVRWVKRQRVWQKSS